MELNVRGTPKEIVDFVLELQSRLDELTCRTLLNAAQHGDGNSVNAIKALCGNNHEPVEK